MQPILHLQPGVSARQVHDDRRNGLTNLYAALEVTSGTVMGECRARRTGADFLRFLNVLARQYRRRELHVILDNSSTHKIPAARANGRPRSSRTRMGDFRRTVPTAKRQSLASNTPTSDANAHFICSRISAPSSTASSSGRLTFRLSLMV